MDRPGANGDTFMNSFATMALTEFDALWDRAPMPRRVPRAPWFTVLGSAMRYVFTLGRRR